MLLLSTQEVLWESSSEDGEGGEEGKEEKEESSGTKTASGVVDVEDVGDMLYAARSPQSSRELKIRKKAEIREMVTPLLRKNLTKQGSIALSLLYLPLWLCYCLIKSVYAYVSTYMGSLLDTSCSPSYEC